MVRHSIDKFITKWEEARKHLICNKFSDYRYDEYYDDICPFSSHFDRKLFSTHSDHIRDKYRNYLRNRYLNMGKLTKFSTYSFENDGENLNVREFKHNFKKISLKKFLSDVKSSNTLNEKHLEIGLPLPLTDNCEFSGVVNGKRRKGYTNKLRQYFDDLTLKELAVNFQADFKEDEFSHLKVFSGDWKYNSQNLIDMATPKTKVFSKNELIEGYLSRINIDFQLPYLGEYDSKYVLGLDVKPKAFPGFSTQRKIAKFRKTSSPYTKDYAKKYIEMILRSPVPILDTSLLVIGGREKRVKFNYLEKGKKIKTRITCMGEDVPTLISQSLVNPITNCIPELPDHFNQLAKVYGQGGYKRFIEAMEPTKWDQVICDLDYSGHDNNTSEDQIVVAFSFLRLCFRPGDDIDNLFLYCMSSMIFKRFVLPESNMVFRINKGISTGHGFTSLVTTLCAYGTLATSLLRVTKDLCIRETNDQDGKDFKDVEGSKDLTKAVLNDTYITNAGDDCTIRLPAILVSPLYDDIINNSGHTIDDIKNSSYIVSNDQNNRITFVKKQFTDFSWNLPELYTNLVHPVISFKGLWSRSDDMKVNIYQSPMSLYMNNFLLFMIIYYILIGDPNSKFSIQEAIKKGHMLCPYQFSEKCFRIGFNSPDFFKLLHEIDYGFFFYTVSYNSFSKYDKLKLPLSVYQKISLNDYIYDTLREVELNISKRQKWFMTDVTYKMHRQKNTLTVYDFLKVFTYPKSNNISFDNLRIHYQKMRLITDSI